MRIIIYVLLLSLIFVSCNSDEEIENNRYEFVTEYTADVNVGGAIGITQRTFEIGEIYSGTDQNDSIMLRIAEHSDLNNDCPNSWCYQEFLKVPSQYLKRFE